MTSYDFERDLVSWLDEAGAPQMPDYVDELLDRARRTTQRPAWASLERWFPRLTSRSTGLRPALMVLALLALIALAATAAVLGSHPTPRIPMPASGWIVTTGPAGTVLIDPDTGRSSAVPGLSSKLYEPVLSPDATRVAGWLGEDGSQLAIVGLDGSGPRVIARGIAHHALGGSAVRWSPDGRSICYPAFGTDRATEALYVADVSRDSAARMIPVSDAAPNAAWSPDGSSIAFGSGASMGLFVARADVSAVRRLNDVAPTSRPSIYNLSWSPDSRWLVMDGRADDGDEALFLVDAVTGETTTYSPADGRYMSPSWAPNGAWIAYLSVVWIEDRQDFDVALWIAHPDGTQRSAIATDVDGVPVWAPDSASLLALKDGRIVRVPIAGGQIRPLGPGNIEWIGTWAGGAR